jgi:hypothetical protein
LLQKFIHHSPLTCSNILSLIRHPLYCHYEPILSLYFQQFQNILTAHIIITFYIVTCLLKAEIAEPEKMPIARHWFCKHVSTATKSRDRRNIHHCNNEGTVGSSVFYVVCPKLYIEGRGCYIRTITARVQLKKKSLWSWISRRLTPRRTDWQ